jgi:polysaccharide pyruvyl transferase WcaK-like protein
VGRILKKILNRIRKRHEGESIKWFDPHDNKARAIVQVSPALQPNGVFVNYGDAVMWWAGRQQLEKRGWSVICLPRGRVECERLKAQATHLFIDCAGFIYSSAHHKSMSSAINANITMQNAKCCKESGAIIVSAPQTFGPFDASIDSELNREIRGMIEQMDLICARDEFSAKYLGQLFPDGDSSKIRMAPDLAFLYEIDSREEGHRFLSRKGLTAGRRGQPLVGLTLNRQLYDRLPSYLDTMQKVIDFFRATKSQVVLIPHEHGRFGGGEKDDQYLCNYLANQTGVATLSKEERLSRKAEVEYIRALEAAISNLDFLVAGRFHAALRGLAEAVPTVAFSWSHKFEMLFKTVGMSDGRNVISLKNLTASGADTLVCDRLEEAWNRREETKEHLIKTIPPVKERVTNYFEEIVSMVDYRG